MTARYARSMCIIQTSMSNAFLNRLKTKKVLILMHLSIFNQVFQ